MDLPVDLLPILTWPKFFYPQQREYTGSKAWQTWCIAGNGTGKTLLVYSNNVLQMLGFHPNQLGPPPIKVRVLVPSFDYVKDVALEKLQVPQVLKFKNLTEKQESWLNTLIEAGVGRDLVGDKAEGSLEIQPMLPLSWVKKEYTKEHKGIELINGSSIWFVTSEQGWKFQRGGEQDILSCDEEGDERVWDELKRGLRNAKGGGKIYAGLTPPYELGQGPTWTTEKILEASIDDSEIHVIHACMADNPAITQQFIEEFSKGKTQKQVDVQVYGKYPTWGDLVHPDFQDRLWNPDRIDGHLLPNDTPMPGVYDVDWVMAFDWHQSKPCAAVFGFIDRSGNITFFDELDKQWAEGKKISELADAFLATEGSPHFKRKFRRWQDPSAKNKYQAIKRGFNAWDAFRQVGVLTSAGKNRDPGVGISIVNEYFCGNGKDHPRMFIYERLKYLRQYLTNHFWKRGEDNVGVPDPKWSDYPITVRYILQEVGWKRKMGEKKWPLQSFQTIKPERQIYDLGKYV